MPNTVFLLAGGAGALIVVVHLVLLRQVVVELRKLVELFDRGE